MNIPTRTSFSVEEHAQETARFMSKVYMWMTIGILLSATASYAVASNPQWVKAIVFNRVVFYALLIGQIGAVLSFSLLIQKINALMATALYLFYALLTGLTLSVIFFVYTQESIIQVFILTAFAFAGLSAFGYFTKIDLGPIGSFCMMGLWGLVGFGVASFFMPTLMNNTTSQVYAIVGILVFSGLTAYDTQKIKAMNILGNEGTEEDHKEAIHGALILYLDFINLFLKLLRLMGRRK